MLNIAEPTYSLVAARRDNLIKGIHFNTDTDYDTFVELKGPNTFSPAGIICEISRLGRWVNLNTKVPGWWDTQYAYVIEANESDYCLKKAELLSIPFCGLDLGLPEKVKQYYEIDDSTASYIEGRSDSDIYDADGLIKILIHEFDLFMDGYTTDCREVEDEYREELGTLWDEPMWTSHNLQIHSRSTNNGIASCPFTIVDPVNWVCKTCK